MNILIFYQYFGTPKGGWSTRMYEMPKAWIADGHQVTVVTTPYDKSDIKATKFIDKQIFEGIEVIIINIKQSNKHALLYRAFTFLLFSIISIYYGLTRKFDVMICSSGPITIGLPGIFAKVFRPKKIVVFEVRDLWPEGAIQLGLIKNKLIIKLAYYFEKICYHKADLIVTCSKGMSDSIKVRYPASNLLTIPNACDVEFFMQVNAKFTLPEWAVNKKIFIYTGSLGLMDDCLQIIKGIEVIQNDEVVFVFIGEGKERIALENYVKENKIQNTYFLGLIPKTSVRSWLQNAYAAFVTFKNLPVLQTSSPNKMFDAFAAGIPIIQSTQGWIMELVQNENCGLSVDPNKPAEMKEAVLKLCYQPEIRNEKADNCKRLAQSDFNRKILAGKYLAKMKSLFEKD